MCACKTVLECSYPDINECLTNNGRCSHFCNNTISSYFCSCPIGLQLDHGKRKCAGKLGNLAIKCSIKSFTAFT